MKENNFTKRIVLMGIMMALVVVTTMMVQIPVPATEGYIHIGDSMIFFSVLLLGYKYGAIVSGVGSAIADLLSGYAHYVPITLVVKGLMAIVMGICIEIAIKKGVGTVGKRIFILFGMLLSGVTMVMGYYLAKSFMIGNFIIPLTAIPMNCIQFGAGIVVAEFLYEMLSKTQGREVFEYRL